MVTIYSDKDIKIFEVEVNDNSYRHRVIMGDYDLTLYYSLAEHVEIPVGSYCIYQGERYTLMRPEAFKMKHSRNFEYTVTMESPQAYAKMWKFRNPVDGRLKFSLTAKPIEHLQMFVDNMNRRDTGWKVGECVDGNEVCISYNHAYCYDALSQMASEVHTEFEFVGKTVHLHKVEYNKNNPLPLSYGRGNGFKPNVGRSNYGDTPPVEILFTEGGTQNIDASKYGSTELLLPKLQTIGYDGVKFSDEDGFNEAYARWYTTDDKGYSIHRTDKELTSLAEDSLDCSDIYPKRVGTISSVVVIDAAKNFYDIVDDSIPDNLNYENCLIDGETMTVIFQSGMLAGKEFEVKYIHEAKDGKAARRFEIVPQEIDGQTMPNETFAPRAGNTYAVFHCALPDAYICDNDSKSGVSWDMFRKGVKYLFDNEETKFTFSGELDGIWSKKDWTNIGGRIKLGGYIQFSDKHFQKDGVLVRITGIKDYINKPYSPELELSNNTVGTSFSIKQKELESTEVIAEDYRREALQFTKRRFRDAKETMSMLEAALLDNFTNSINPIAIQTMQMLVGDESLQFRFVNSKTNPVQVAHGITYDTEAKQLSAEAGIIQHLTLGINTLSSSHKASEYKYWDVEAYESARLDDGSKKYYLYAKVSKADETGVFLLSETAIALEGVSGYYHLLVGVLNSEYDGERSFATLYGFSEILPGRITTDRVVSGDGNSYFDMVANAMKLGGALDFNSKGDGKLRIKGTIVQSQGGSDESYIGCYRGVYNNTYTYFNGDEVSYTYDGNTSTYRMINDTPCNGIAPTNTVYWQVFAQGSKGNSGRGIETVTNYYAVSASGTEAPTSWQATPPQTSETNRYLWNYETITYTDGTSEDTEKRVIGTHGAKGDSIKGDDGRGIQSITEYYLATAQASGVTASTSGWTTAVQTVSADKKYLWNYELTAYTDGASEKSTPVIIGMYSADGQPGKDGATPVMLGQWKTGTHVPYLGMVRMGGSTWACTAASGTDNPPLWTLTDAQGNRLTDPEGYYLLTGEENTAEYELVAEDGQDGKPGKPGEDGAKGNYTELRFAKNGSTSTPPSLTDTALNPSGWNTTTPSVGTAEYLWMTSAVKDGANTKLVSQWTTPVRITPYDGKDGADGKSPVMVYRDVYDSTKTYYGNQYRLDCVKYGGTYYIARIDAGTFTNIAPPNTSKWNEFGAQFESVATQLLLAQYANIGNFVIRDNCIISQKGTVNGVVSTDYSNPNFVPNIMLDGKNGQSVLCGSQRSPFVRYDGSYYVGSDFSSLAECYDNLVFPVSEDPDGWGMAINFPWSTKCNGRKITLVNYKWKNETSSGKFEISAPTDKGMYFYEDGLQKDKLQFSREVIELLGYGDDTTFFGWIVVGRHDIATVSKYGREFKVLAMGEVTGTSNGATIKYHTFDGSTLSVSRSSKGKYRVSFPSSWGLTNESCLVTLTPITQERKVTGTKISQINSTALLSKSSTYFDVNAEDVVSYQLVTGNEQVTEYDGSFQFLIANLANWSY